MAIYLGIDAGGTKTHAIVADDAGHILGAGRAGSANWESVTLEGTYRVLSRAIESALQEAHIQLSDISAAGYGLAGLDWPNDEVRLRAVVDRLGISGPQILVNDAFVALRAGATEGVGVAAVAGTGTAITGRNRQGELFRTFALGAAWGDFGSGHDIAELATRAVIHAYTGRGQPTMLTERLVAVYGARDILEMAERISRGLADNVDGWLAPLVFAAANEGDAVAQEIVRSAGEELGRNAGAVARRLGMAGEPFDLVMGGSIFSANESQLPDMLLRYAREYAPLARPVRLFGSPAVGGVLLAMDAAGVTCTEELRQRLLLEVEQHSLLYAVRQ
jgi:N-acetylglucosamine kinase-like BadF-type ATPase